MRFYEAKHLTIIIIIIINLLFVTFYSHQKGEIPTP